MIPSVFSLYLTKDQDEIMRSCGMVSAVPDVPHHHVDEGVLYQTEEHEEGAGGHEHVYCLTSRSETLNLYSN